MSPEADADLVPRAAVVRLDVARRCAVGRNRAAWPAFFTAPSRERIRVLDRTLWLGRVIAAVKRRNSQLLQPPDDRAHT